MAVHDGELACFERPLFVAVRDMCRTHYLAVSVYAYSCGRGVSAHD